LKAANSVNACLKKSERRERYHLIDLKDYAFANITNSSQPFLGQVLLSFFNNLWPGGCWLEKYPGEVQECSGSFHIDIRPDNAAISLA
jgi:hypothetical protein